MKFFNNIVNNKLFYGLISLGFVYINYSFSSWNFFNKLGGLVGAKVYPEVIGIAFFLVLSKIYISKFYPLLKIHLEKRDFLAILFFIIVGFVFRYKEFYNYFWRDDFYLVLNRLGTGYSLYQQGIWLSSFSLWLWELIRLIFGYSILPYQVAAILSHILLTIGVYFLSKYLSKSYYVGLITSFFVLTTTITFEAFQWLIHPISFGWQGFFVCMSAIACVWEIRKTEFKAVPYLSAFLMMSVFAGGIARIGFVLPFLSVACLLAAIEFLNIKKWISWALNLLSSQWIFYFMVFIFFTIRGLWGAGVRSETTNAPFYKIYLFLIGTSTFPVEIARFLNKLLHKLSLVYPTGIITVWLGFVFLLLISLLFLILKLRRKKIPIILSVGVVWLLISTFYYALFAPHVPVTQVDIDTRDMSLHLSYLTSIGSLMIWGYLTFKILKFFYDRFVIWGRVMSVSLIIVIIVFNYFLLSKQYDDFLDFPKNIKITRQQFFFESYLKYISLEVKKVNIFYDDGYLKRKDNYKPNISYYLSFWDISKVSIFYGDKELKDYLVKITDPNTRDEAINNLYYIYTDYDDGLIEENLSFLLRNSIKSPMFQKISIENWKTYWGKKFGNIFLPEIITSNKDNLNYFRNPIIFFDQINFGSVLTPKLKLKLNVQEYKGGPNNIDLRSGIFSQILNTWSLPTNEETLSLIKSNLDNPAQNLLAFNNLIDSTHIKDKMICGKDIDGNNGIAFIVIWFGEPSSYNSRNINKDFLSGYLDKYYSICYFSDIYGIKEISLDLSYLGSILRKVVIVPLTTNPVTIKVLESSLESPRMLK